MVTKSTTVTGPLPGAPVLRLGDYDLAPFGYVVEEWLLHGEASSYDLSGAPSPDGRWQARFADIRPFTTRVVVVRPTAPQRFDGTVVLEWLNVSGGTDFPVEWLYGHRQLLRHGSAWVGVTVQSAGVDGGGLSANPAFPHLKAADPDRYRDLLHPGDAYAFDIFSSAARAVQESGEHGLLGPLRATTVLAAGASQSASFLVTYLNAVDPLAQVVDGALLHGRGAQGAWLDGTLWDPRRMLREAALRRRPVTGHRVRTDVRVPVLVVQAETDLAVLGGVFARQPDTPTYRLWEVAGSSHLDTYGFTAAHLDDGTLTPARLHEALRPLSNPNGLRTSGPINSGPQLHYVMNAALAGLAQWVRTGVPPAAAPRLRTKPLRPMIPARNALGIVEGGLRTPWVDVPTVTLSGFGQRVAGFGLLFGSTRPLPPRALAARYPDGREEYDEELASSAAAAVAAGHLRPEDLQEMLALGRLAWPGTRRGVAA